MSVRGTSRRPSLLEALEWQLADKHDQDWFESVVSGLGGKAFADKLLQGTISVGELQQLKEWAKRGFQEPAREDAVLRSALAYYLTVAAALRHHEVLLSDRPWSRVVRGLARLAPHVPRVWRELFEAAIRQPEGLCVRGRGALTPRFRSSRRNPADLRES